MKKYLFWFFLVIFIAAFVILVCQKIQYIVKVNKTRIKLTAAVSNAALAIDAEDLIKVPLIRGSEASDEYKEVTEELQRIKKANPGAKYVYTMSLTKDPGILKYIVDAEPLPEIITAKSPTAFPGDKYDARNSPEMLKAFGFPTADRGIVNDAWGATLSGYAPIFDSSRRAVAILGIDVDAGDFLKLERKIKFNLIFLIFASILVAGTYFSQIKNKRC